MRKTSVVLVALAAVAAGLVASVAFAAPFVIDEVARVMNGGFFVHQRAIPNASANKVTRMLGGSATIDFVAGTIICTDSTAITVTGALVGDACFVGGPAAPQANSTFTCYVSATDNVKVRHCPVGTAADPASATYYVRVVSSQ